MAEFLSACQERRPNANFWQVKLPEQEVPLPSRPRNGFGVVILLSAFIAVGSIIIFLTLSKPPMPSPNNVLQTSTQLLQCDEQGFDCKTSWQFFRLGQYYWEGYIYLNDERNIEITIEDCHDSDGNEKLNFIEITDSNNTVIATEINCEDEFTRQIFAKSSYYRICFGDNDTGGKDGNKGILRIKNLADPAVYLNPPQTLIERFKQILNRFGLLSKRSCNSLVRKNSPSD